LPEVEIPSNAYESLAKYMSHFADRGSKIHEGLTSNIVECFFSVNNKFQQGKIKNLITGKQFSLRCKIAGLCFNEGPTWN
jgi:hypothetical protein